MPWATSTNLERSDDGGRTWRTYPMQGVHVHHHAMWFDQPDRPHMLLGNDGGIYESYDEAGRGVSTTSCP